MLKWIPLADYLPTGDEYAVLLYPCNVDCGLKYITSNPQYAIKNGIRHGYTHWAEFELAPDHDTSMEAFSS